MKIVAPFGGHYIGEVVSSGKTLLEYCGQNSHGHHLWMWACPQCQGASGPSTISHLNRSKLCRTCSWQRENNGRWLGHEQISGSFLYQYRNDARKKGREWQVSPQELWQKWIEQQGRCAYTGWYLEHGINASIDRIDSTFGYLLNNVQWVHRDVNRIKSDFSETYFKSLCLGVADFSAGRV